MVLHRPVEPDQREVYPELGKAQWIDFNQQDVDFSTKFNQLIRTLDTDREHVQSHTKWSQRAMDWEQADRNKDLLLRESELAIADTWLQNTEKQQKQPVATPLQKAFIEASAALRDRLQQQEENRRRRELRLA